MKKLMISISMVALMTAFSAHGAAMPSGGPIENFQAYLIDTPALQDFKQYIDSWLKKYKKGTQSNESLVGAYNDLTPAQKEGVKKHILAITKNISSAEGEPYKQILTLFISAGAAAETAPAAAKTGAEPKLASEDPLTNKFNEIIALYAARNYKEIPKKIIMEYFLNNDFLEHGDFPRDLADSFLDFYSQKTSPAEFKKAYDRFHFPDLQYQIRTLLQNLAMVTSGKNGAEFKEPYTAWVAVELLQAIGIPSSKLIELGFNLDALRKAAETKRKEIAAEAKKETEPSAAIPATAPATPAPAAPTPAPAAPEPAAGLAIPTEAPAPAPPAAQPEAASVWNLWGVWK